MGQGDTALTKRPTGIAGRDAEHRREGLGGGWLILDGIDQLLSLEPDPRAALDQVRHLND